MARGDSTQLYQGNGERTDWMPRSRMNAVVGMRQSGESKAARTGISISAAGEVGWPILE